MPIASMALTLPDEPFSVAFDPPQASAKTLADSTSAFVNPRMQIHGNSTGVGTPKISGAK